MKIKKRWITTIIILIIIVISIIIINSKGNGVSKETATCIGENSELYTQFGCHACQIQEEMFGKNYQYLNVIDCWYERDKCFDVQSTPTWVINNQKYTGVQSVKKLKELTGCE